MPAKFARIGDPKRRSMREKYSIDDKGERGDSCVHSNVNKYLRACRTRDKERQRTNMGHKRSNPNSPRLPFDGCPYGLQEYNGRLCVILLQAILEKVKVRLLQDVGISARMHATIVVDVVRDYVAPGCHEKQEGIMQFQRITGCAGHVEEAMDMLRAWVQAHNRA